TRRTRTVAHRRAPARDATRRDATRSHDAGAFALRHLSSDHRDAAQRDARAFVRSFARFHPLSLDCSRSHPIAPGRTRLRS
ncbi:hypothetical protein ACX841_22620, partial [Burkholderia pseudomallei]